MTRSHQDEADAARAEGTIFFVVGVGDEIDLPVLQAIAGNPDFVFDVGDFSKLGSERVVTLCSHGVSLRSLDLFFSWAREELQTCCFLYRLDTGLNFTFFCWSSPAGRLL